MSGLFFNTSYDTTTSPSIDVAAKKVIWTGRHDEQYEQYQDLIDFIKMLNNIEIKDILSHPLKSFFSERVTPKLGEYGYDIRSDIDGKKVFYPCAGADGVTPFLLPGVKEAILLDNNCFFDREKGAKLEEKAIKSLKDNLKDLCSYSGLGDFDRTDLLGYGFDHVTHKDKSIQTYFITLVRLKVALGAKFTCVELINGNEPDLGYTIHFTDNCGKQKILKYFQLCVFDDDTSDLLCFIDPRNIGTGFIKKDEYFPHIKSSIFNSDFVLIKAAGGAPEKPCFNKVLSNWFSSNPYVVRDSLYDGNRNGTMFELAKNLRPNPCLKQLSKHADYFPYDITIRLGYSHYSPEEFSSLVLPLSSYMPIMNKVLNLELRQEPQEIGCRMY